VLNQYEIQEAIEREVARMEELITAIADAARQDAMAEADLKIRFAKARLLVRAENSGGQRLTADMVDDHATVATEQERYAHLIAQNNLMATREAFRASQAHLDALRTLDVSHRQSAP
jgi:hypothetical protein